MLLHECIGIARQWNSSNLSTDLMMRLMARLSCSTKLFKYSDRLAITEQGLQRASGPYTRHIPSHESAEDPEIRQCAGEQTGKE